MRGHKDAMALVVDDIDSIVHILKINEIKRLGKEQSEMEENNKIIIPNSETIFKAKDDVVFFSESKSVKKLEKLLSIRQDYF